MCANNGIHYGSMAVFDCLHFTPLHYYHYADVSEGIELLKYLSGTPCRVCVCLRLSQFSQLSFMQHMGLCIFNLPILLWWLWEYMYLPLFRVRSRKNGMLCMSFYILTNVGKTCISVAGAKQTKCAVPRFMKRLILFYSEVHTML